MKKWSLLIIAVVLLLSSGCSIFRVKNPTFNIPRESVQSIEIQREYKEDGKTDFRSKKVTEAEDVEILWEKLRFIELKRAKNDEPHAIERYPLIIILRGKKDHHLILDEKMAFYDQVAYEYTDSGVYEAFNNLYSELDYPEAKAEAEPF